MGVRCDGEGCNRTTVWRRRPDLSALSNQMGYGAAKQSDHEYSGERDLSGRKLRGEVEAETDMVEDLMGYLDDELPKAEERDVEEVLDKAAPVLAALLVPMKKKYDKIVEIKNEVTEQINEVIPVEELVADYEETLEDLKGFCKHLTHEMEGNIVDNIDELHRKLWELDSTTVSDLDSLSSWENLGYIPASTTTTTADPGSDITTVSSLDIVTSSGTTDQVSSLAVVTSDNMTSSDHMTSSYPLITTDTSLSVVVEQPAPTLLVECCTRVELPSSRRCSSTELQLTATQSLCLPSQADVAALQFYSARNSRRQSGNAASSEDIIYRYVYNRPASTLSFHDPDTVSISSAGSQCVVMPSESALSVLVQYVRFKLERERERERESEREREREREIEMFPP
eukprot:sb/3465390/